MADIGNMRIRISLNSVDFSRGVQDINRRITALNSELRSVTAGAGRFDRSLTSLRTQQNILNRTMEAHRLRVRELRRMYEESAAATGENSDETIRLATQYHNAVAAMRRTEDRLDHVNRLISEQTDRWQILRRRVQESGERLQNVGRQMTSLGKSMTMSVSAPIAGVGIAAVKSAIDFESAFAGVRKTVDATEKELSELEAGIRNMAKELPASAVEIAGVAEAAGQLGIETENILKFTRTMIDMGEATNLSAEQAATEFARFANIVGMSQKDFDRLGATVVALGNNFATTEREIVEMAMRLAGAGSQVGLTEAQIMAFATALSSVGIEAEMGGSAFSRVMIEIANASSNGEKAIKAFADVAGMSAKDFKKAFEEDAAKAVIAFIKGLDRMSKEGKNVFGVLDDLGLSEIRVRDTLLRAAGAADVFTNAIEMGSEAWEENNALTKEATERYKTTESQIKMLWNRIKDLGITIGRLLIPPMMDLADKIEAGIKRFDEMDDSTKKMIVTFGGIAAATGPALTGIGFMAQGAGALLKVVAPLIPAIGASGGLTAVIGSLAGPAALATGAIVGLTAAVVSITKDVEKAKEVNLEHAESLVNQKQELESLIAQYEELSEKNKLSNAELMRFRDIQSELELATSAQEIKRLNEEQAKLQEKSGLTNDELQKFIGLNDQIIETVPNVDRVYSDRGNAIITHKEALSEANEELRKQIELELENQRIKAEAQLDQHIRDYIRALDELQAKEAERDKLVAERNETEKQIAQLRIQAQNELNEGKDREAQKTIDEIVRMESLLNSQNTRIGQLADEVSEKQKSVEKTQEQIGKTQELYNQMINLKLQSVGINQEGEKGIAQLDDAIKKTQTRISELQTIKREQGSLNAQQQEELGKLQHKLGVYQDTKSEIKRIQGEQATVNAKINEGTGKARNLNKELSKDAKKNVDIDDRGQVDDLNKRVSETRTKKVRLSAIWEGISAGARKILGFKTGTKNAPGGLSAVAEDGRELIHANGGMYLATGPSLVNLPKGAKVIPNRDTEAILRKWNIPMMASGGITISEGLAYIGERGRELIDLTGAMTSPLSGSRPKQPLIIQLVTPDNREMAKWLVDDITDLQGFKQARIRLFEGR